MALRNIVTEGDSVLRKTCRSVLNFDEKLAQLLDDMKETMYKSGGVGLAAPQVGVLRRVVVMDVSEDRNDYLELINPEITFEDGSQTGNEGCLSIPDRYEIVTRPMKVTVRAQNRYGENIVVTGEELKARALCHEIDHLDGVLYIDHAKRSK